MTIKRVVVPIAALAIGVGSSSMAGAQAGERHHNRQSQTSEGSRDDRSARQQDNENRGDDRAERRRSRGSQQPDQEGERARVQAPPPQPQRQQPQQQPQQQQRDDRANRERGSGNRDRQRNSDSASRDGRYGRDGRHESRTSHGSRNSSSNDRDGNRGYQGRSYDRDDHRADYSDRYRGNWSRGYNGYSRGYYAPRPIRRGYSPRDYYGSGGHLSLYFGWGSGYRYGSLYSGRVYGYRRAVPTYGSRVSYGDIRLKDFPRDGAVYVDGYYAGVVDDFDGFFQHLTLEVGPHEIEVEVPGAEAQSFDVYVDPYNTIDLHAELWR